LEKLWEIWRKSEKTKEVMEIKLKNFGNFEFIKK
jgi:hypothetical protein